MLKLFLNKFGKGALDRWWADLHTNQGMARRYLVWCTAFFGSIYLAFAFDIPFKEKTAAEWAGYTLIMEPYRLHQHSEDWIVAIDKKADLKLDCIKLEAEIQRLNILRIQLLAIRGLSQEDRVRETLTVKSMLSNSKKKLAAAEFALTKTNDLLERLVASR